MADNDGAGRMLKPLCNVERRAVDDDDVSVDKCTKAVIDERAEDDEVAEKSADVVKLAPGELTDGKKVEGEE